MHEYCIIVATALLEIRKKDPFVTEIVDISSKLYSLYHSLGILHHMVGKYATAEFNLMEALLGRERILGRKHPSYLETLDKIGVSFLRKGDFKTSTSALNRAFKTRVEIFGSDSIFTCESMKSLAILSYEQGQYEKSSKMLEHVLNIYIKHYDKDHQSVLEVSLHLAKTIAMLRYQSQEEEGHLAWNSSADSLRCEELCQSALVGFEKLFGPNHSSSLDAVSALALIFALQAKYPEAREMCERALKCRESTFGQAIPTIWLICALWAISATGQRISLKRMSCMRKHGLIQVFY